MMFGLADVENLYPGDVHLLCARGMPFKKIGVHLLNKASSMGEAYAMNEANSFLELCAAERHWAPLN